MSEKEGVFDNINYIFRKYSGKEELEKEISKLQSHLFELELDVNTANKRYEKSAVSEKKAVAAKQEAEEKLKAAEVRLQTLEHELEKARKDTSGELYFSRTDRFSKQRTEEFLLALSSVKDPADSLVTVYIAAGSKMENLEYHDDALKVLDSETIAMVDKVDSPTGLVLFYSPDFMITELIVPPLPLKRSCWSTGNTFDTAPVLKLLRTRASILFLVAHAGESLIGYSHDSENLDSFQLVKSSVKAKHAKGGFSQRRFERLRDEDIAHHIDKVKPALRDLIDEYGDSADYFVIAGDRQLAEEMTSDLALDIERVFSSSDIRVEKHNIPDLMKQLLIYRRYRI
ncbi:peptide chain release factor-like protein [Methanolobus zinderi]|uniref:Peptide chain release factor-like protein n=1 Tax=Methanolobus zinderi TaxID=536044 RepID=A0A7D5IN58_9EURY|nr:Vms1/Ankzf1 family peptidyl-tRNA hydrolase [Methanolobus zinderi]QLC49405.1 peptide chain release factor-like protein [Methanolobus zinderi]